MGFIHAGVLVLCFLLSQVSFAQNKIQKGILLFPIPPVIIQKEFLTQKKQTLNLEHRQSNAIDRFWIVSNVYAGRDELKEEKAAAQEERRETQKATWQNFDSTLLQWMNQDTISKHPKLQSELRALETILTTSSMNYRQKEIQILNQYVSILSKLNGPYAEITQNTGQYLKQLKTGNDPKIFKAYGSFIKSYSKTASKDDQLEGSVEALEEIQGQCSKLEKKMGNKNNAVDEETEELLDDLDSAYNRYLTDFTIALVKEQTSDTSEQQGSGLDSEMEELLEKEDDIAHRMSSAGKSPVARTCSIPSVDSHSVGQKSASKSSGTVTLDQEYRFDFKRSDPILYAHHQEEEVLHVSMDQGHTWKPVSLFGVRTKSRAGLYHLSQNPDSSDRIQLQQQLHLPNQEALQRLIDSNHHTDLKPHEFLSARALKKFRDLSQNQLTGASLHLNQTDLASEFDIRLYNPTLPRLQLDHRSLTKWKLSHMPLYKEADKNLKMYQDLLAKVSGDSKLRTALLQTDDHYLVEWIDDASHEDYWGVHQNTGKGKNHFGKILMLVRAQLKNKISDQEVDEILKKLSKE